MKSSLTFAALLSHRGVAQPGLEYASGGRVVASSNLVTPTERESSNSLVLFFVVSIFGPTARNVCAMQKQDEMTMDAA